MISSTATRSPAATSSPARPESQPRPRARVAHEPAVVPGDPVSDPVHLDEQVHPLARGDDPEPMLPEPQPPLVGIQALGIDLDRDAVNRHAVKARTDLADRDPVALTRVAQLDLAPGGGLAVGAPPAGQGVEGRAIHSGLLVGEVHGRGDQRDLGMTHRGGVPADLPAVEPARVDLPGAELGERQQVEQKAHVRGAALDDDRWSRRARAAGVRGPRRGPFPRRSAWRSSSRTGPGSNRPRTLRSRS